MKKILFEKDYSGEEILDFNEDVMYAVHASKLPSDEYGFFKGTISIQITYSDYEGEGK